AAAYGASPAAGAAKEIEQLQKVVELEPAFTRARVALGKAYLRDGKVAEAVKELEAATRLSPDNGEARYQLGPALARSGRKDEATSALEKGRELVTADDRTKTASLDILEGRAALEKGDLDVALAKLRRAIQLRPDASEAHLSLGAVLEKKGDAAAAIASYEKALELNPADAKAQEALQRLRGLGTTASDGASAGAAPATPAPPAATSGVASSGDDPARVAELERSIREGRYAEVEPLLAAYVKDERPQSSWGWYALGYSLFAQQKLGEAIQALARSLQLDVKNAEAHKILGRTLMLIGRFDAARLEFEQGIRLKPDSAE